MRNKVHYSLQRAASINIKLKTQIVNIVGVPCYSMGTAPRMGSTTTTPQQTPGPGQYTKVALMHKMKAPNWVFGTATRTTKENKNTPGPGQYTYLSRNSGPKFPMALKTHYSSQQNLNPGPGNYNIRRDLGRVSYSFGLKGPGMELGTKGSPGPGAYSLKTSFANIPGSRIGTGKRDDEFQRARRVGSPGPGAYTISRALHHSAVRLDAPQFGFGTQSRNKHSQSSSNLSPGPGQYSHKTLIGADGQKRSIIGSRRPASASATQSPGPAQYSPKREFSAKKMPQFSIGTASRDGGLGMRHCRFNPGPNQYNPSDIMLKKEPSWRVGTSQRRPLSATSRTPGPGNYNIAGKAGGPKYVMGMKGLDPTKSKMFVPGPGQYAPDYQQLRQHHPTIKIGSEQRIPRDRTTVSQVPGPGNYNPKKRPLSAAPQYGFGSGTRETGSRNTKDTTPGPGSYRLPSKIQDVPHYILPNRSTDFKYV